MNLGGQDRDIFRIIKSGLESAGDIFVLILYIFTELTCQIAHSNFDPCLTTMDPELFAENNFPISVRYLNLIPGAGIRVLSAFHVIATRWNPSFAHPIVRIGIIVTVQPVTGKGSGSESWCPIGDEASAITTTTPVVASMMPTSVMSTPVTTPAVSTMSTASFRNRRRNPKRQAHECSN